MSSSLRYMSATDVKAVRGVNELSRDPHLITALPHRTLQHVRNVKLLRNLADLDFLALERK